MSISSFVTSLVSNCQVGEKEELREKYLIRSYDHFEHMDQVLFTGSRPNDGPRPHRRKINFGPAEPMEVWQVARAATAAPLYFEPFETSVDHVDNSFRRFTDGGLHAPNNPTLEGIREVGGLNGHNTLHLVMSVGTARTNEPPGRSLPQQVKNIIDMGSDPQQVHETVDLESKSETNGFEYFRFNDTDGTQVAMDECEPRRGNSPGSRTFETLRNHFQRWVTDHPELRESLWSCAVLLVKQRRKRTQDKAAWETFSTGSKYRCPYTRCEEIYLNRDALIEHVNQEHDDTITTETVNRQRNVFRYQSETG